MSLLINNSNKTYPDTGNNPHIYYVARFKQINELNISRFPDLDVPCLIAGSGHVPHVLHGKDSAILPGTEAQYWWSSNHDRQNIDYTE